jgi:hypothetical protein
VYTRLVVFLLQIVHSEQIRGYPRFRKIFLKCDVFGIAGFYTAVLRPPKRRAAFTHIMNGQLEVGIFVK